MNKMMLKKQYMMYSPKKGRLPSGYQEVEYIQSTGTQYIDTNHIFTADNQKLETKVKFITTGGRWAGVFKFNVGNALSIAPYNNKLWFGRNGDYYTTTTYNDGDLLNIKAIAKNRNLTGYVNGQEVLNILYSNTYTPPYNYYLFAQNYGDNNNSPWGMGNSRIYYFRLYENDVIIRDFIPCYRKSDNEIGLYDIVGNKFYTNQGSGAFIKGADV